MFSGWIMQEMSKIVCRSFQRVIKEGQRLKIIKLGNYNAATELLIDKGNTELLSLIRHWDKGLNSKGTTVAVCMEGMGVAMRVRNRAAYMWSLIGDERRHGHNGPVEWKGHQRIFY